MGRLQLWHPPEKRTSYVLYDENGLAVDVGPTLSAEEVFCDFCNADIILRPVPTLDEWTLCEKCMERLCPDWRSEIPLVVQLTWAVQLLANE